MTTSTVRMGCIQMYSKQHHVFGWQPCGVERPDGVLSHPVQPLPERHQKQASPTPGAHPPIQPQHQ